MPEFISTPDFDFSIHYDPHRTDSKSGWFLRRDKEVIFIDDFTDIFPVTFKRDISHYDSITIYEDFVAINKTGEIFITYKDIDWVFYGN